MLIKIKLFHLESIKKLEVNFFNLILTMLLLYFLQSFIFKKIIYTLKS